METMTELLGSHPFFAGLSSSAVDVIAGVRVQRALRGR
jgi:hypothetical protein